MTWSDVVNHKQFFHWRITDNQKKEFKIRNPKCDGLLASKKNE